MTRKEQNKILDDKIESNVNQYKIDRLNAEISASSSGDLNKYEFLTRKDLKYKPNALDKARFEFSPLGRTFSIGLDKTVPNYQEEGVIKLLKGIRDGLAGGIGPRGLPGPGGSDRPDDDDDDEQKRLTKLLGELRTNEDNEEFRSEPKEDELDKFVNDNDDKVFNVLNKFKNNIESEMSNLDKMAMGKENKWSSKLNKLNNEVKKLDNYIKENNDKKINIEKKLDIIENEHDNLLLKYNQSNQELKSIKNELYETKDKLDKTGNDINEKAKYIDELKEIQEKFDYQNNEVKKLKSKLNEKNKNINTLKNNIEDLKSKNFEIITKSNEYYEEIDKLKKINNTNNQRIQELEEERIAKTSDDDKVFNVLNKFRNNIESEMSNLDKIVTNKENKWNSKLNKLNNDVKKLDNCIKENNDKKINTEKKIDAVENECNNLLLKYNQSNEELNSIKNEFYETKKRFNKVGNDINEKLKHIDELKEIQEKFDYQNNQVK